MKVGDQSVANAKPKTKAKPNARPKTKRKYSFILTVAVIALIGYFTISIVSLQLEKNERQKELDRVNQSYSQKLSENEELEATLTSGDDAAYIERIARDVLGYVLPGERVFYDITSGK